MNGRGTLTSPDGCKYEGGWKDGRLNGKGTLTHSDGSKDEGGWKDGKLHGKVSYIDPNGNTEIVWYDAGCVDTIKTKEERDGNEKRVKAAMAAEEKEANRLAALESDSKEAQKLRRALKKELKGSM